MKKVNLHTDKLKAPFFPPDKYFEEFSEKLTKRIEGSYEPEILSKKLPFGVPEKYFELLPQRIAQRISQLKKKVWYQEPVWQWAVAVCSITLLLIAGISLWTSPSASYEKAQKDLVNELNNIDKYEIEQYLVANHRNPVIWDEMQNADALIMPQSQYDTTSDTLLQSIPKDVLEESIPQDVLQEMVEEELQELEQENEETIFLETDTI